MVEEEDVTIEFKGKSDHISERMKEHATRKLARLARYRDQLTRIEVVAEHVHSNPEVELIVHLRRGSPLVSKDQSTSFSATVDLLVDKVETLLRKQKEKRSAHKSRGEEPEGAVDPAAGREPEEETYEDIVRKSLHK